MLTYMPQHSLPLPPSHPLQTHMSMHTCLFAHLHAHNAQTNKLRSCVKVEVAVPGSSSLISLWFLWT